MNHMSRQFVVMFDSCGVDTLIPCDEMKTREMLEWLGGKPHKSELARHIRVALVRAQSNPHRFPEVWAYDCAEDHSLEEMRGLWGSTPQHMADLVRSRGTCLYKTPREKVVIT